MPRAQKRSTDGLRGARPGPRERQGGQARSGMWCSFHPRRSCTAGAALCMAYCSDVAVVLCQLRHIRTCPHAIAQSWRGVYKVRGWAGTGLARQLLRCCRPGARASTSNSRHGANHWRGVSTYSPRLADGMRRAGGQTEIIVCIQFGIQRGRQSDRPLPEKLSSGPFLLHSAGRPGSPTLKWWWVRGELPLPPSAFSPSPSRLEAFPRCYRLVVSAVSAPDCQQHVFFCSSPSFRALLSA